MEEMLFWWINILWHFPKDKLMIYYFADITSLSILIYKYSELFAIIGFSAYN